MILLTTSRRPTTKIRTLCHDFVRSIPNIVRITRGKLNLDGIAEKAIELNASQIVIIDRCRVGPGRIKLFRIGSTGLVPVPPLMYLAYIKLRRGFGAKRKYIGSLVVTTEPEDLIETERIAERLSDFFSLPRLSIGEAVTKYQVSMNISLDVSHRTQITFMLLPQMVEIGPRVTISKLLWEVPT